MAPDQPGFEFGTQITDPKLALDPAGHVVVCGNGGPGPNRDYLVIKYQEVGTVPLLLLLDD